jgi:hypothetical protein
MARLRPKLRIIAHEFDGNSTLTSKSWRAKLPIRSSPGAKIPTADSEDVRLMVSALLGVSASSSEVAFDFKPHEEEVRTMAQEPFINPEERPDLTVDLNARVGDLTVRQLSEILGSTSSAAKLKEAPAAKEPKEQAKEPKELKDHKDVKDHKDPKEHKDQKDNKDHKDPKDQKDQKDQKEPKDHKDQKDNKDQKDPKDPKDPKDQKDHKDPKEHKDHKDIKDRKEGLADKLPPDKVPPDKLPESQPTEGAGAAASGLEDIIKRVAHLEQEVAGRTPGGTPAREPKGR